MKYCASSQLNELSRQRIDEIRFSIQSLNAGIAYAQTHPEKKIIIEYNYQTNPSSKLGVKKMYSLQEELANLYIDFATMDDLIDYYNYIKENHLSEHRYMYHRQVGDWASVKYLLHYQVSDIILTEPLIFSTQDIKKYLVGKATLRMCPHIIHSMYPGDDELEHFWVLPQHIDLYENIIDVIEIIDEKQNREETLVKLYAEKKFYDKGLNFLVENLTEPISAKAVSQNFATKRLDCNQSCVKSSTTCHYCKLQGLIFQKLATEYAQDGAKAHTINFIDLKASTI